MIIENAISYQKKPDPNQFFHNHQQLILMMSSHQRIASSGSNGAKGEEGNRPSYAFLGPIGKLLHDPGLPTHTWICIVNRLH